MKFTGLILLPPALAGCLFTQAAAAHHTATAFYELGRTISVEGTVTGMKLANPHSYFRVTSPDGADWAMEAGGSWTQLQKDGWSHETIPEGSRVRISGSPSRDGKPIARYSTIAVFQENGNIQLYGGGRSEWIGLAREMGNSCDNGVEGCLSLDSEAVQMLQQEYGNVGVWSAME